MASPAQRIPLSATNGTAPLQSATAAAVFAAQTVTETAAATNIGGNRSLSIYVTDLAISNLSATASVVTLLFGVTPCFSAYIPATSGPQVMNLTTPLKGPAGAALNIQSSSASATIYWTVSGYAALN